MMPDSDTSAAWLADLNGSVTVGHGPFRPSAQPPADGVAFYVQDFCMKDAQPWKIPARVEVLAVDEFAARLPQETVEIEWQVPDPSGFSSVFQEIMHAIHSGVFEKTVPVAVEHGKVLSGGGAAIVRALLGQKDPLLSYGWLDGERGFAGATPELLFATEGREFHTMALAGTARGDDRDVFAVDDKEIREHEYVAQTLVSKLTDLGELVRHPREILALGNIVHFLTRIDVRMHKEACVNELMARLHPTPALGPLPRTEGTMEMLRGWRERLGCPPHFGAPFGMVQDGNFRSVVAIRGLWWSGQTVSIPSGCGIIEASRLVNEWRELRLKRESVKRYLAV